MNEHPAYPDFWEHDPPKLKPCWVCGEPTSWVYLDMDFQHPGCDLIPTPEGGAIRIVNGYVQ